MPLTLQFEHIEYAQSISVSPMPENGSDVTTGTNRVITYGDDETIASVLVQIDKIIDTSASDKSLFVTPKLQYSTDDFLTNAISFQKSNTGICFSFNANGYTKTAIFELSVIPKRSKMIFGGGPELSSSGNIQIPKVDGTDDIPSISCGTYAPLGLYSIAIGNDAVCSGENSQAFGDQAQAYGVCSHAEGVSTVAKGNYSHAEGNHTKTIGNMSHAEGQYSCAIASYAHAEGYGTTADYACHSEGYATKALSSDSHAEGYKTIASMDGAHAEGSVTEASGYNAHAEGEGTNASASCAHAEGSQSKASGLKSHAEGDACEASGEASHSEGCRTKAYDVGAHAEGYETIAMGSASHAAGKGTIAYYGQYVIGRYNMPAQNDELFVVGNGTDYGWDADYSTALYLTEEGDLHAAGNVSSYGADYAELFEWTDRNPESEDRVGHFVTMDGELIQYANPGDYILGIVSGNPALVGNDGTGYHWKYERDPFGRIMTEYLETVEEEIDVSHLSDEEIDKLRSDRNVTEKDEKFYRSKYVVSTVETEKSRRKINPDYNSELLYIERKDRPEWDYVGMLGVLPVYDDGTCEVNSYCQCGENGIATKATMAVPGQAFRVIKRVGPNIIKVVFR